MSPAFEMAHTYDHVQARADLVAALSHDLRTPLMVLLGAADLLLRGSMGELTDEQRALVEVMRRHTLALAAVVDDVVETLEGGDAAAGPA